MLKVNASIVLYNQNVSDIAPLFEVLAKDTTLSEWVVVDNGGSEDACALAVSLGGRCIKPSGNIGYGAGHNLALHLLATDTAPYHLVLNPDIELKSGALEKLAAVMDVLPEVGLLMPRVTYPNGSTQYLCKLLPTPFDLFLRRFTVGPLRRLFSEQLARYEMKEFDYLRPAYVPVLSGCFMFLRRSVLQSVGGFDERFFLYMEDVDLCRRIGEISRLLFWPGVTVVHNYAQGSYKSLSLLRLHLHSAVVYFNKWGWYNDPLRIAKNAIGREEAKVDPAFFQQQPKK